jgi:hypothetical protein
MLPANPSPPPRAHRAWDRAPQEADHGRLSSLPPTGSERGPIREGPKSKTRSGHVHP